MMRNARGEVITASGMMLKRADHVYIITSAHGVKIGKTSNVIRRFATIKCHSPVPLKLAHSFRCPDATKIETQLHRLFKDVRIRGEWFKLMPGDVAFLCELNADNFNEALQEFILERNG